MLKSKREIQSGKNINSQEGRDEIAGEARNISSGRMKKREGKGNEGLNDLNKIQYQNLNK